MYEKYIGHVVTIIYEDKKGNITQRRIRIRDIAAGKVRAYDFARGAPRVFESERILAVQAMNPHVS